VTESPRPPGGAKTGADDPHATTIQHQVGESLVVPLAELLVHVARLQPEERIPVLWRDMRDRWSAGVQIRVEDYLEQLTNLAEDDILDLVYAEFALREEWGAAVDPNDFLTRFPAHAPAIRRQLDLHGGLSTQIQSETQRSQGVPFEAGKLPVEAPLPERLGRYVIVSKVGDGGQSNVYLAIHPELKRNVVIKCGKVPMSCESHSGQRLVSEAQILAQLDHPNLARVYDLDFCDGFPYLVIEHVRGRSLAQYAEQEKPTPRQSALIVAKVARALAAAHELGVLHLDVKPHNILIDEAGEPRLIDFGLSRMQDGLYDEKGVAGELSGTLLYMSPEQARGESNQVRQAADIYGVGAVLYYLLTGHAPYQADSFSRLVERVRKGDWDTAGLAASEPPRALSRICTRALAHDPDERFARIDEMATQLENYANRRTLKNSLMVAGILVAIVLIGSFLGRGQPTQVPPTTNQPAAVATSNRVETQRLLQIRVWDLARYVSLTDAVPLYAGDELQIVAEVPAGMAATLVLYSSEGELKLLAETPPADESQELRFPSESNQAVPLEGAPGTEFVMVCCRVGDQIPFAEVAEHFADSAPWPALPGSAVLRASASGIEVESRGRDFGAAVERLSSEEVVRGHLETLLRGLADRFDHVEGVAFAHQD